MLLSASHAPKKDAPGVTRFPDLRIAAMFRVFPGGESTTQ